MCVFPHEWVCPHDRIGRSWVYSPELQRNVFPDCAPCMAEIKTAERARARRVIDEQRAKREPRPEGYLHSINLSSGFEG